MSKEYEDKMIEAFVNKANNEKTNQWYKTNFKKYGKDKKIKWSWWAFFGNIFYLLYRKAYIEALVLLFLTYLVIDTDIAAWLLAIFTGGYAPYIVFLSYTNKKSKIEKDIEIEELRILEMQKVGGYNQWVVYLTYAWVSFIVIVLLLWLFSSK